MSKLTRRDFLKYCGAGAATVAVAAAIAGCSSGEDTDSSQSSAETNDSSTNESSADSGESGSSETVDANDTEEDNTGLTGADYFPGTYEFDSIRVVGSRDNGSFYPGGANKVGSVQMNIFQYLLFAGDNDVAKYCLLKSIDKISDIEYACELWDFIYDTDGRNMKASDVEYSFTRYVEVDGFLGSFSDLDHIEVTGDYTFNWICKQAFNLGELIQNFSSMPVFIADSYEASGDDGMVTCPVGTGPYMLESYTTGSQVGLVVNEDLWMKNITDSQWLEDNFYMSDAQNAREIIIDIVAEASSRAIALEMGDIVAVDSLNVLDALQYMDDDSYGIDVILIHELGSVGITFNCTENSPCSDINFRKGICYLIDSAAYADGCSYPAEPCYGYMPRLLDALPEWNDPSTDYYNYDFEKAKELIESSSYHTEYNDKELVFLYNSSSVTICEDIAIMLQSSLKEVGVKSSLLPADMAIISTYSSDYTSFDISVGASGGGKSYVYAYAQGVWTENTSDGLQPMGIADDHLDDLYVALMNANDDAEDEIREFDQYYSYEMCYHYSILCYDSCAGCRSDYNSAMSSGGQLVPGAITKKQV